MADHCPACRIARELTEHRDATAADWSTRRGVLNFARVVAERACPDYTPATEPRPTPERPEPNPAATSEQMQQVRAALVAEREGVTA